MPRTLVAREAGFTGYHIIGLFVSQRHEKAGKTRHIHLGASKVNKYIGWSPTSSLDDLRETIEHFRTWETEI